MSERSDGLLQVAWAQALLEGLRAGGVERVVLSPGSRSTPLVLAVAEVAAREEDALRCYDVVDERSAAFFALGQARATGLPTALICTSGSAPAHYFPAVLEAEAAFLPLVVVSADRPLERLDGAAPQTVDQIKLFGDHVRGFFELGAAHQHPRAHRALQRRALQAALLAREPIPGPVHLNVRFRRPLEPSAAGGVEVAEVRRGARPVGAPPHRGVDPAALELLIEALLAAQRPLCVLGPAPLLRLEQRGAVLGLLRAARLPVYADAASQLRFLPHREREGILWLDALGAALSAPTAPLPLLELEPDLVLQLGAPPVPTAWERFLESRKACRHLVVAEHGWPDPISTAECLVQAPLAALCEQLTERVERLPEPLADSADAWHDEIGGLEQRWRSAVATSLAPEAPDGGEPDTTVLEEARAVRAVIEEMPEGGVLMVSNSLPVRFLDTFSPGVEAVWQPGEGRMVRVLVQRGLNGIDGLVSGAAGAASVGASLAPEAPDRENAEAPPFCLLIGDVALLHDLGGLAALRHRAPGPFAVVVLHNDGGRIFEQLPVRELARERGILGHWTTPHGRSFRGAAEMFGLRYQRAESEGALRGELRRAFDSAGAVLIEVPLDADSALRCMERLARALRCEPPCEVAGESEGGAA